MDLQLPSVDGSYSSASQIARVRTEKWAAENLYCVACNNSLLQPTPSNCKGVDFYCSRCGERYQLKSGQGVLGKRIVGAAYNATIEALLSEKAPNLLCLQYLANRVVTMVVVPRHFLTLDKIEKRPPLQLSARRAGWVGCNIRVDLIPPEGRIEMIRDSHVYERTIVRDAYQRCIRLKDIPIEARGWLLAVLAQVHILAKPQFSLAELYSRVPHLETMFPLNNHVKDKVRQQLQRLRDLGFIDFVEPGQYKLK